MNGPAPIARYNASKLILDRINELDRFGEWTDERPIFLMGDFNCQSWSAPYIVLVGDDISDSPELLKNSKVVENNIDWILYKGDVEITRYVDVDYNVEGVYPSDYNPVYIEVNIPPDLSTLVR